MQLTVTFPVVLDDTVYFIVAGDYFSGFKPVVKSAVVKEISWISLRNEKENGFEIVAGIHRFPITDLGENFFLTQREAEAALVERTEKQKQSEKIILNRWKNEHWKDFKETNG